MDSLLHPLVIGGKTIKNNVILGPMAGVTDYAFRTLCGEQGAGLCHTEMVSTNALHYGSERTKRLLATESTAYALSVQLFGHDPALLAEAARTVSDCEAYTLIDINMGCPAPKIVKNGDGSALMRNPALAGQLMAAAVKASRLPVTVKLRRGFDSEHENVLELVHIACEEGISAVTVHGRTREEFYSGHADWNCIAAAKAIATVPVIGNGDVVDGASAIKLLKETGCDGIMIARGSCGNPFIFAEVCAALEGKAYTPPTLEQRVNTALRHIELILEIKPERVAVQELRKHLSWYVKGLRGASKLKLRINTVSTADEARGILKELLVLAADNDEEVNTHD